MQIGYKTDRGRKRQGNEDAVMVHKFNAVFHSGTESVDLFVVADGMGGHNAGEVASKLGSSAFASECLRQLMGLSGRYANADIRFVNEVIVKEILEQAIKTADDAVSQKAREQGLQGMGTTLVAALLVGQYLYVINVGDSRCYLINNRETLQLTTDHSLVQQMVDAGMITPEEALTHARRNEISRAIGSDAGSDFYFCRLYEGDAILLCSDGLSNMVSDQQITEVVLSARPPDQACDELVNLANQAGGADNITVLVARPERLPSLADIMAVNTEVRRMPAVPR